MGRGWGKPVLAFVLIGVAVFCYISRGKLVVYGTRSFNYLRSFNAPAGILVIEAAPGSDAASISSTAAVEVPGVASGGWPAYNRTLTSDRYSPLHEINSSNVAGLKVICTYDTKEFSSFQTGPIVADGQLIITTEMDIISIDPDDCAQRWRTHETLRQGAVNRGAAYSDGLLYRGTGDGRVIAYDASNGRKVWDSIIADPSINESVPAAPIAWEGMVFVGTSGGDKKGVKGRMYALDAKTGKIFWEFFLVPKGANDITRGPQGASTLDRSTWGNQPATPISGGGNWTSYTLDPATGELYVPAGNAAPDFAREMRRGANLYSGSVVVLDAKTGAYKRHFPVTTGDWHDWDVSNTPSVIESRNGKKLLTIAPKDGRLYGFDLNSGQLLYRTAVNRIENADVDFSTTASVHFCPGARGGAEWNGAAYDPKTNLVFVGEVDWCTTIKLQGAEKINAIRTGGVWAGMSTHNPYDTFGTQDDYHKWAGWVYAVDADTGAWKWRARTNYPIQSGVTATAGDIVLFGDMGGNFYALDTASGRRLWGGNLGGGAVGGGVITYKTERSQKLAVATGFTSVLWPTKVVTGKIYILGLAQP